MATAAINKLRDMRVAKTPRGFGLGFAFLLLCAVPPLPGRSRNCHSCRGGKPGEHPECCDRSDGVSCRAGRPPGRRSFTLARGAPATGRRRRRPVVRFDAHIEPEQRQGDLAMGQTDLGESTGETEPISRPKLNATSHGYDSATGLRRGHREPLRWRGIRCLMRSSPRPARPDPG